MLCMTFHLETEAGNAAGAVCVFPFIAWEVVRTECLTYNATHNWCATTDTYDDDGKWGLCKDRVTTTTSITTTTPAQGTIGR